MRHVAPALFPAHPLSDDTSEGCPQILTPPRTAPLPWMPYHQADNPIDSSSILPSSRPSSPSKSSTFLPFLKLGRERSVSPKRVSAAEAAEFAPPLVNKHSLQLKAHDRPGKLADWFSGTSEPVNITLIPSPTKEKQDPFVDESDMETAFQRRSTSREEDHLTRRPQSRLQKSSEKLPVTGKEFTASKLAFWKQRPTLPVKGCELDEPTDLDFGMTLFPSGGLDDSCPEELEKVREGAEKSFRQLQSAYQKNLQCLQEVTSERNALTDEWEAAQTRSEHLKLQLATMGEQLTRQESAMQSMVEEIATLRRQLREDEDFRNRSLRVVSEQSLNTEAVAKTENEGRRRKRRSAESLASEASSSSSIFSQAVSGTCSPISVTTAETIPDVCETPLFDATRVEAFKECQNCHGIVRSEAWNVVHVLKEESRALKARIAQCENANEGALNLLDALSAMR